MTVFTSYLTEEVVEDFADGIISRREAMRRLGMLGVGRPWPCRCWLPAASQETVYRRIGNRESS